MEKLQVTSCKEIGGWSPVTGTRQLTVQRPIHDRRFIIHIKH